jgi:hypothetical protein
LENLDGRFWQNLTLDKEIINSREFFGGQLELIEDTNKLHYQIWLERRPRQTKTKVLNYFSREIYIFEVLTEEISNSKDYCRKEAIRRYMYQLNIHRIFKIYGEKSRYKTTLI